MTHAIKATSYAQLTRMESTETESQNEKSHDQAGTRTKKASDKTVARNSPWFNLAELLSEFRNLMFKPVDASALAVFRILFGITMFLDVPDERGFSRIDEKWGQEDKCTFPLINGLKPLPFHWMCGLYLIMWLGTIGITLGYKYHTSCLAFCIPYWYLILLDKTYWNNHTYLFGLIAVLLYFTDANACWSFDKWINNRNEDEKKIPLWNYFILRYQVFILYFMAGLKKFNWEWLGGYSMISLADHIVFKPFKLLFTNEQIDYWIVHVTGFLIDSFAGFGLHFDTTRLFTFIILTMFHLMNSRLFAIGMFPYVGIVTMFIFCDTDWPRQLIRTLGRRKNDTNGEHCNENIPVTPTWKQNIIIALIMLYMSLQLFLPYSHFITKGYNGWSNGLYGYSWDMMVHSWDTSLVRIKIVDNHKRNEYFLNPQAWVESERWAKHPDMVVQYVKCAKRNVQKRHAHLVNVSIYVDVWCSLNGRLYQRMYNPNVDILNSNWSPFERTPWLMPLLTELDYWRDTVQTIQDDIYSTANVTDAVFLCDFPGLYLENYVQEELVNTSLAVLKGTVLLKTEFNESIILNEGNSFKVRPGTIHYVHTISNGPSCYMYSYLNYSASTIATKAADAPKDRQLALVGALCKDFVIRLKEIKRSLSFAGAAMLQIINDLLSVFF